MVGNECLEHAAIGGHVVSASTQKAEMNSWTNRILQGMDRVVSPTVPNPVTLDTDKVQGQWSADSGWGFA